MKSRGLWALPVLLVLTGWVAERSVAQTRSETLFVRLGIGVEEDQRWDGSIDVSGGEIVQVEGWQFTENDSLSGPNSWRLTNRRDEVAGFARINYTEMSPAQRPKRMHFPVGVFVTVKHSGGATASVQTTASTPPSVQ